jgi:antitoxin PrlF
MVIAHCEVNFENVGVRVMLESIVAISGRTTLPKAVRFALGLAPGDRVRYTILDGEVRLLKARPVAGLAGILARPGQQSESIEDMEAAVVLGAIEQAGPTR